MQMREPSYKSCVCCRNGKFYEAVIADLFY